jgi:hypothetical protein
VVRALLVRGMLAGALAGLLAAAFAWVVGEPPLERAIAFERQMQPMVGEAPEQELVGRGVQSTAGLLTGVVVYGAALGGIFALVFAFAQGRVGRLSPRGTAALLAAAGYGALILVPQIKYPGNPPTIGDPATIGPRTAFYFEMIAISALAAVAAISTAPQLARRLGAWNGALAAGAAYLAVIAAAMSILPPVNEVPPDFPATTLWSFRIAGLGIEAVLWTTLGLAFGALAQRQLSPARRSPAANGAVTTPGAASD